MIVMDEILDLKAEMSHLRDKEKYQKGLIANYGEQTLEDIQILLAMLKRGKIDQAVDRLEWLEITTKKLLADSTRSSH